MLAAEQLLVQEASLERFSGEQATEVPLWQESVETFEEDPSKPNPFELPPSGECSLVFFCSMSLLILY